MTAQYQQQAMSSSLRFNPAGQTAGIPSQTWTISPQDRLSYEKIFLSLRPIAGKITGPQAKSYLMQSTLPAGTLAHVWSLADVDGDGQMTVDEFSIAMHLIRCRLQGVDLPQSLPPGLRMSSVGASGQIVGAPTSGAINFSVSHPGMQMYNTGSPATLPNARKQPGLGITGTGKPPSSLKRAESMHTDGKTVQKQQTDHDVSWAVQASAKKKYNQLFNAHDRLRSGFLTGAQVRAILLQSNLSQQQLAQIWSLSDIDNDGRLSNEEFAVAMHLVDDVHAGKQLPTSLPVSLIPPSMRKKASLQQQAQPSATPDMPVGSSFPVHTQSFEDKKRENFKRGQLELEKRRQERREKEQKEKEKKERRQREFQERQERERREAEERRLAALEIERQKEMEKMRLEEEEQQKINVQKQSAQKEMELAREREWQRRRKQELETHKSKISEAISNLKQRVRTTNTDLEMLSQRHEGMLNMLQTNHSQIEESQLSLARLSQSRDIRAVELDRLHTDYTRVTQRLNFLSEAKERLTQEVKEKGGSSESTVYKSVMDQCHNRMAAINRLRSERKEQQEKLSEKRKEGNAHQAQLMELNHSFESLAVDVKRLQHEVNVKNEKHGAIQQRRQAEEVRIREEEIKRQRHESERIQLAAEETRKREEERQHRENEARQRRDEQLAAVQRGQEGKRMREQLKPKQAEETQKVAMNVSQTKEGTPGGKPLVRAKRDPSQLVQSAARKKAELDADAERRRLELAQHQQREQEVRKQLEQLHKERAQQLEVKKKQEQETAKQVADEVRKKEAQRKAAEEAERLKEIKRKEEALQQQKAAEAQRKALEEALQQQKAAEEAYQKAVEAERLRDIQRREEALQQQKAAEEAKKRLEAVKEKKLAEEAKKREKEQADAKRKEIEARKQALVEKKAQLLRERNAFTPPAVTTIHYQAEFDFAGRSDHELSFRQGDVLTVSDTSKEVEQGWLMGTLNGREGLFPENYCIKLEAMPSVQPQKTLRDKSHSPPPPQILLAPVARPRPHARNPSPLSTSSGDDVYAVPDKSVKGRETSPDGLLPTRVMAQLYTHSAPCSPTRQMSPAESDGEKETLESRESSPGDLFKVVALYPWRAQKDDHLSFGKDDVITVYDQNEMWYSGTLGGKTGWFPKSYVKPILGRKSVSQSGLPGVQSRSSLAEMSTPTPTPTPTPTLTPAEKKAEMVQTSLVRPQEYVALYNYTGSAGDLSFKAGDVIDVTQMTGEWWTGTIGDRQGIFPGNYVKKRKKQTGSSAVKNKTPAPHQQSATLPATKRPLIASVVVGYDAQGPEQLSLQPGQLVQVKKQNPNGWWEGELQVRGKKRKIGWFPSNRVKLMGNPFQTAALSKASMIKRGSRDEDSQSSSSSIQDSPKGDNHVLAIYSYTAAGEDELTFNKGSVITVLSKESEWWKGELNGIVGVFPSNYVQPLSELQPPSTQQWSDTISPVILQGLGDSERKRQEAIFELVQTEQSYVDSLNLVVEIFMEPMAAKCILNSEELHTVFVNWKDLITSHDKLLKALKVRLKMHEGVPIPAIGDLLCEQLPRLTAYIRFCSRQLNACNFLQSKNTPALKEFETECARDHRTGGLRLSSFLLKPMQRVTKYPLLVEKILKYTPSDHADYESLAAAQKKAEDLCSQVNEGVRMQENSDRLEWFQTHINITGLTEELVFNSPTNCLGPRKLLYSGNLRKARSGRELFVVLFNDFLMMTQSSVRNPIAAIFDSSSTMKYDMYRKPLFVDEVTVNVPASGQNADDCHFYLSCRDEKPLILKADNTNERNSWIHQIENASKFLRDKKKFIQSQEEQLRKSRGKGIGTLIVRVVEASNLSVADITGKSDPYCEVGLGVQTQKTAIIEKTLNPKWNMRMDFSVRDLKQDRLSITVFDHDLFSPSDFLGRAEVLLSDLLKDGKGPWDKWLVLQEVTTGEVHVQFSLKLHPKEAKH